MSRDGELDGLAIPHSRREYAIACEAVVDRAQALIGQVRDWFPQWTPPPFDPRLYAEMLSIPVIMATLPVDLDAIFIPVGDRPRIMLNKLVRSKGRRNFSLAHEIAHSFFPDPGGARYFLRARGTEHYGDNRELRYVERLCDAAATELLMPSGWFLESMERHGVSAASLIEIAAEFAVSLEAAALRLTEVNPRPCEVFLADEGAGRPSGPWAEASLVVRRVFANSKAPGLLHEGASVPCFSLMYQLAASGKGAAVSHEYRSNGKNRRVRVSACALRKSPDLRPLSILGVSEWAV